MAASAKWYGKALSIAFGSAPVNWASDTIKVALCTASYVPDQDNHDFFDDITNEVTGTGYSAGGATLGTKTNTYTAGTNTTTFDAADTSWPAATITARYAIIYKSTGTASTSLLLGYVDFGENIISTNGTFTITWASGGILEIVAS
jgi:hypothetical protein